MNQPQSCETETKSKEDAALAELYLELARERHVIASDKKIEIDSDAEISVADEGAWVAAWVWVDRPDSLDND